MGLPSDNALLLFVDRLARRSVLIEEERRAILALPTTLSFIRARRDIVRVGEEISHVCLIASGIVGRFDQTREGERQITAFHIPGDMADLHSTVRPVGVGGLYALCDTAVLHIPHIAIRTLAARYPAVAEAFWRDCMLDAAILMQWVVNVARRDGKSRIAHMLCEMASRAGHDNAFEQDYSFPVTQEQIGEAAGLTGVHVNRTLKALRDLATIKGGRVAITDWAALSRLADFHPAYLVADTGPARQKRLLSAPLTEWHVS